MTSDAKTPAQYIKELPEDRKLPMTTLRNIITKNLPDGFKEGMSYGMICYAIPHSLYPDGYHCDPKQPLPFLSIASQKNFVAVYHMGIYADPVLMKWFLDAYPKHTITRPDMGKSCIRFKKMENIPYQLIGELAGKMTANEWITLYEQNLRK
jgi:hypothetical protein